MLRSQVDEIPNVRERERKETQAAIRGGRQARISAAILRVLYASLLSIIRRMMRLGCTNPPPQFPGPEACPICEQHAANKTALSTPRRTNACVLERMPKRTGLDSTTTGNKAIFIMKS
jgi:hypothetical protein